VRSSVRGVVRTHRAQLAGGRVRRPAAGAGADRGARRRLGSARGGCAMKLRGWLIGLLALVPLAAIAAWWDSTYELVGEETAGALRGAARYNQFYALEKVLLARGLRVESRARLQLDAHPLADDDTLILAADVRTLGHGDVERLLGWVERGGQFLFSLPAG